MTRRVIEFSTEVTKILSFLKFELLIIFFLVVYLSYFQAAIHNGKDLLQQQWSVL